MLSFIALALGRAFLTLLFSYVMFYISNKVFMKNFMNTTPRFKLGFEFIVKENVPSKEYKVLNWMNLYFRRSSLGVAFVILLSTFVVGEIVWGDMDV